MNQYFPASYPGWLLEGYAEYMMTAHVSDSRFEIGRFNSMRIRALGAGSPTPVKDVLTLKGTDLADGRARGAYYAWAWLLTHFMLSDPERKAQLMAYVRGLNAGQDSLAAWTAATGETLDMLQRRLDTYRTQPFAAAIYDRPPAAPAPVSITRLPASADDLILLDQRVRAQGVAKDERAGLVDEVRTAAARHPGDRPARLALARAEVTYGDRAAGEAVLEAILAQNPDDLEALRLMGHARLRAGREDKAGRRARYAEAGRYFARAYKIEPNHYQTLHGFAQSRSAEPDYPSDNTLNVLRLAVQIAPQVDALGLSAGQAMVRRGLDEEAANLLTPVANDPHGRAAAAAARALLAKIAAGRGRMGDKGGAGG